MREGQETKRPLTPKLLTGIPLCFRCELYSTNERKNKFRLPNFGKTVFTHKDRILLRKNIITSHRRAKLRNKATTSASALARRHLRNKLVLRPRTKLLRQSLRINQYKENLVLTFTQAYARTKISTKSYDGLRQKQLKTNFTC